ncbi:MAG: ATP-binding protein [Myxococcaceae bacterium]
MRLLESYPARLATAFVGVIVIVMAAAVMALTSLARAADQREVMNQRTFEDLLLSERLRSQAEQTVASSRGYLVSGDAEALSRVRESERALEGVLGELQRRVATAEGQRLLTRAEQAATGYRQTLNRTIGSGTAGASRAEVNRAFEEDLLPMRRALDDAIDAFVAHKEHLLDEGFRQARREEARAIGFAMAALVAGAAASGLLAWTLVRRLGASFEMERASNERAKRALATRDEVLGIVAHDLRNPLNAISMKAGLWRKKAESPDTRAAAAAIEGLAMRTEYLIKDLLDATTIEVGRLAVNRAPCAVEGLVRETIELFESAAAQKGVELRVPETEPGWGVLADRVRIVQVLSNLVGNALKFTPAGGRVTLVAARRGDQVRFEVSDTGRGIPREQLPHVFERFWKADSDGRRGAGLGLYIARGIIEAHGAHLQLESEPGRGSAFSFMLPAVEPPHDRPVASVPAPAQAPA